MKNTKRKEEQKNPTDNSNTNRKKINFSIIISALSLVISVANVYNSSTNFAQQAETRKLNYYVKEFSSYEDNGISTELEFIVQSGAVSDVSVFTYKDGKIKEINQFQGGKISKDTKASGRVFKFMWEAVEDYQVDHVFTQYVIVDGMDGTRNIYMILCYIKKSNNAIQTSLIRDDQIGLIKNNDQMEPFESFLIDFENVIDIVYTGQE